VYRGNEYDLKNAFCYGQFWCYFTQKEVKKELNWREKNENAIQLNKLFK